MKTKPKKFKKVVEYGKEPTWDLVGYPFALMLVVLFGFYCTIFYKDYLEYFAGLSIAIFIYLSFVFVYLFLPKGRKVHWEEIKK